jgi:hypothetical protein
MLCKSCKGFATKTTPKPAQFLLYGCRILKRQFGVYSDFEKKAPKNCGSYETKNL